MQATTFTLERPEGVVLFVYRWLPDGPAKAVVQIAHGWGEHAGRYTRAAEALCREGDAVYANDHRGHGRTARTSVDLGFFAERDGWNTCELENVQHRFYPNGRHESLNEINRDEVTGDLVRWLNSIFVHDATSSSATSAAR